MNMVVYTLQKRWERGPAMIGLQKMPIFPTKQKIIFSYEDHFDLGGYVNNQNSRIWGIGNPHVYTEMSKHPNESLF